MSSLKNVLILAVIVFILGSLKPDSEPCRSHLFMQYYRNGKKVYEMAKKDHLYFSRMEQPLTDLRTGKKILCDSIVIKIVAP